MSKKYLFSTDDSGRSREIKVDPKNLDRQIREEQAAGRSTVLMDEDERIRYGLLAQQIVQETDHQKDS